MNSDYFGMNHTQATDQTILNSANTNRSARKGKYLAMHPSEHFKFVISVFIID